MDVIFDSEKAAKLLRDMEKYCSSIEKETNTLFHVLDGMTGWKDNQFMLFNERIDEICAGLDAALKSQSNYMNLFAERIRELQE